MTYRCATCGRALAKNWWGYTHLGTPCPNPVPVRNP